ncbi:multidrug efflux RND transporter permease subunit [Erwinia sp. Leaf53]|uniref:multidrug efflux RND transporter permease subunit n=1 Tax=Erwinia sp. Leaf53 TaxID=1736225 RepID=UPI0006FEFE11|nr:multidrug efflux RND transporter permease subunit [Erwinia sp. Leaf53]KQN55454.1 acriflavine resistance protein B [Erwinia sp. Leaf53]
MPQFFIHRPVFAWVVALFIVLSGVIAIPQLPVAQYPSVAPPQLSVSVSYPGATPETMNTSVISLLERDLSGVENLLYFESSSDTSGSASISITFRPGTDIKLAQVDVQNKLKEVESRLPAAVRQNGLSVEAASSGFLMLVGLKSPNGSHSEADLSDWFARNASDELKRVPGVGKVQLFGAEKAMRVWLDPDKLFRYRLSVSEVIAALSAQNALISPGRVGDEPAAAGQRVTYPLTVRGQLHSLAEFRNITLKAQANGARVRLGDVARVEQGLQSYAFAIRENGQPSTAAAIQLSPGANAVSTAAGVRARLAELNGVLPDDMAFSVPFDTAPFVKLSIEKVIHTFLEAMVLVFLVMLLFLQNLRYTFIPAIVAPVALMGTFTVMLLSGFSINVLTMFGMVLAIGIIVDDAIVVVENVERLMAQQGLSPKQATQQAMQEITPAIIGITLVLTAVFIPMAFASGSVGIIYRQFTLSMAVSILISAFLALTLTPALCASLLKPVNGHPDEKKGFFGGFNRGFNRLTAGYESGLRATLKRGGRVLALYGVLCVVLLFAWRALPSAFLPDEDQGYFMTSIQLPSDATQQRTREVVGHLESLVAGRPGTESNLSIFGFSFSGSGPNTAMAFTTLREWDQRQGATAAGEAAYVQEEMSKQPDATVMSLMPPAIAEMGTSSGFTLALEDRAGHGYAALMAAAQQLTELANQSGVAAYAYIDGLPEGVSAALDVDREKAQALGVTFEEINQTLSAATGSYYVNDYTDDGRVQQVIVQADVGWRMHLQDVLKLYVKNESGEMVPFSAFASAGWTQAPQQLNRFQGYPAVRISGGAAEGASSGAAMAKMEQLMAELPKGYLLEWTGSSLQERDTAAQMPLLAALSVLVVFMVLAALYESWSVPVAVMLVVPAGLAGALAAVWIAGMPNDVFFKVGVITLIGLSAKNAILIVEFARQLHAQGTPLLEATVKAARLRLRPILMTSLAFTLGVVPLMLATGASESTQHAIGTGVFGGMISGTLLAIFVVPVLFIAVTKMAAKLTRRR